MRFVDIYPPLCYYFSVNCDQFGSRGEPQIDQRLLCGMKTANPLQSEEKEMQIEKRNIGTCVVLSIVTCGIYGIFWAVKMLKEAVQVKDQNDDGLVEILLGIFLCPVGFYLAEKKLTEGCQQKGIQHEDRTVLYLVLGFIGLGIVNYIMMQSDLNKIADIPVDPYQAPQDPYQQPYQPPYQAPQDPYQQPYQPPYQEPVQPQQPPYQEPAAPQQPYDGGNDQ